MNKVVGMLLAGLALGLLLASSALAECGCKSKCGERKCGSCTKQCMCESNKCGCASQNYCKCKSKCRSCWGGCGQWVDANACCPPQAEVVKVCSGAGECGCGKTGHPYERVFDGSSMICDTGCSAYIPCKRVGLVCETKCEARSSNCGCDKCQVDYCVTQECHEIERPRVVPWWFNGGKGNVYIEGESAGPAMVADWAGGSKTAGAAGSPEAADKAADVPESAETS